MSANRRERGQAVVVSVVFLVVLVGMAAAVLDVGSWYREDRDLQKTMDAAALAGAQALPDDPGGATALADEYSTKNGGGLDTTSVTTVTMTNDTIEVVGSRPAPGFFSKIFGIDSVTVNATAKARVGVLTSAKWAAPIAVDRRHPLLQCNPAPCSEDLTELELEKTGPGAFRLINIDQSHGGTGPQILADWILHGYEGFMPLNWYFSDSGAKFNSSEVKDALDAVIGKELLFPVYDDTQEQGSNFEYEVIGWVGFVIESYDVQGSKHNRLHGHFTRVIWEGINSESAGSTDFGAHGISLVE